MESLLHKLSEFIVMEHEAVLQAAGEEGILEAVAHHFHEVRLPSVYIHEWPAVVAQLSYYRKEGLVLCAAWNQQAAPLELLSVGRIHVHEME